MNSSQSFVEIKLFKKLKGRSEDESLRTLLKMLGNNSSRTAVRKTTEYEYLFLLQNTCFDSFFLFFFYIIYFLFHVDKIIFYK